ncbi:MAG: UTP--glucose-1-phosphate uridylyltransferase [Clostridia bacterium]|nr:UTP--glucose-1-phosphate uridylyltransferase [Clostridia bacterium]
MKVTKAVIPAAGLGTRFLPSTKAVPKEMMTIVDKPTLHYIVEEAVLSGAEEILIVVNDGKECINHYFAPNKIYDALKKPALEELNDLLSRVKFHYATQKVLNGNGSAILLAKDFADGDPVSVLFGDDIIYNPEYPATKQLVDAFIKTGGKTIVGCQRREPIEAIKYGVISYSSIDEGLAKIDDIVEKPPIEELPSDLCSLGRFVLPYSMFDTLAVTPFDRGEIILANAIRSILKTEGAYAYEFKGIRYDIGDKFGFLQANVEYALRSPFGDKVKSYLKDLSSKL